METVILFKKSYRYLTELYAKPVITFNDGKNRNLGSQTRRIINRIRKKDDRWFDTTDVCYMCGRSNIQHRQKGFCMSCDMRVKEMRRSAREIKTTVNLQKKRVVIIYMPESTNSKTTTLSKLLGCNKGEVENMAIDFMYDFLMGYLPRASKEHGTNYDISSDGIMKLLFRLRAKIMLEGAKALENTINSELDAEQKAKYRDSFIPGYSQVGGPILTSMTNREKI